MSPIKTFSRRSTPPYYAQALKLVEDGEYDKATEIFAKLGEYEDCPTQLLRIHALKAEPVLQQRRLRKRHRGVQGRRAITATPPPASRRRLNRLGAQQLANGEVRKAYDTLYPHPQLRPRLYAPRLQFAFYIQIYDSRRRPPTLK